VNQYSLSDPEVGCVWIINRWRGRTAH